MKITKHRKTALLLGASNMVVAPLLLQLLDLDTYQKVILVDEKKLDIQHQKLEQLIFPFDQIKEHATHLKADDLYCFLGTQRPKNSKDDTIKVREMYSYQFAKIAVEQGCNQLLILSSVHSNMDAISLKNRLRAHVEKAVQTLPFWAIHIFRPSVVLNFKRQRPNGRTLADRISNPLDFFTRGLASKYRPIEAEVVAQAMIEAAQGLEDGTFFYPPGYFQKLSIEKSLKKI